MDKARTVRSCPIVSSRNLTDRPTQYWRRARNRVRRSHRCFTDMCFRESREDLSLFIMKARSERTTRAAESSGRKACTISARDDHLATLSHTVAHVLQATFLTDLALPRSAPSRLEPSALHLDFHEDPTSELPHLKKYHCYLNVALRETL